MRWYYFVLVPTAVFIAVFLFVLFNQPNSAITIPSNTTPQNPSIEFTFKEMLKLDWDIDLKEISRLIPKGKMEKHKSNNKEINIYSFVANFKDIGTAGWASFQSNENGLGEFMPIRSLSVHCDSNRDIEIYYDKIINLVKSLEGEILHFGKSQYHDETYEINDPNKSTGTKLDFNKDYERKTIRIMITPFKVIQSVSINRET